MTLSDHGLRGFWSAHLRRASSGPPAAPPLRPHDGRRAGVRTHRNWGPRCPCERQPLEVRAVRGSVGQARRDGHRLGRARRRGRRLVVGRARPRRLGAVMAVAAAGPDPRGGVLRHRLQRARLPVRPGLVRRPRAGRAEGRRRPGDRRGRTQRLRPQPSRDQGRLRAGDEGGGAVPHRRRRPGDGTGASGEGAAGGPAARPPLAEVRRAVRLDRRPEADLPR